jgi:ABC-type branched-subunit amino acid transport system ATPase component
MIERLYRQTHVTVLMVSHETSVLPPACERIVLMADGRVVADAAEEDILSPEVLRKAYPGDFQTVLIGGRRYTVSGFDA